MAKTNKNGTMAKAGSAKPAITTKMLFRALERIPTYVHKDGKTGHSLAAIRGYIRRHYGLMMTFARQELLKTILEREFERGLIFMVNYNGKLNYTKRFDFSPNFDEIEMEDGDESDPMSSGDDKELGK